MKISNTGNVILASLMTLLAGCGYTTSSLSAGYRTVCVESFANKIALTTEVTDKRMYVGYRSGMELDVTRSIIDRFVTDGHLRISDRQNTDLVIEGALVDFRKEALRFDADDNIQQFRLKVIVDLKVYQSSDGKVIFDQKGFTGETDYATAGTYAKSEEQAIRDATQDLAARVVEKVVEGW